MVRKYIPFSGKLKKQNPFLGCAKIGESKSIVISAQLYENWQYAEALKQYYI